MNELHVKTPHERETAFKDRIKKAQDRMKDTEDKDAKKMLQSKIKIAKLSLQNYKQQQALKDKAEREKKAEKMKNEEVYQLTPDQSEMVKGIIDMLLQVKDIDNRMEMAKDQIEQFKKDDIRFNYAWFLSAAGLDNKDEPVDASAYAATTTHINPGTVLTNIENEDAIPGGLAKGLTLNDISEKHGISVDMMVKEFKKGIKVEMEHTTDVNVAKEIALDHLFEDPKYYDKLATIENMNKEMNEAFKHIIRVETPTQVVSKPVAAQVLALAKKGVRANEIGLEMGFVGNAKLATDAFQKVKNKIYFELDKRNESMDEAKKVLEPKDDWGVRLVIAIDNNVSSLHKAVIKEKQDINKVVEAFGPVLKNAIKETLKHKYKPHPKAKDADNQIKTFISELKKFEKIVDLVIAKPTKVGVNKLDDAWRSIWNYKYGAKIGLSGELFDTIIEGVIKEGTYKSILSNNKGKMFFSFVDDTTDAVTDVDAKTWLKSSIKDKASDHSKEEVLKSLVKQINQFNKKVDFNMWVNANKPTWEEKVKYLLDKGLASNVNKNGIKVYESVNEGKKAFKINPGIGSSKYSISSHDGVKKHKDGSDFWDIEIFKNKVDLEKGIKKYTSNGFVKESVNEATILVRKVMGDDVEKFLKKYPKVKQTMSVIAKKNTDLMKGYKAFLKFKDAQEDYLGGRAEVSSSPTFGSKTFYKYDWGNVKNHWPEVYQYIYTYHYGGLDGATVEGINEGRGLKSLAKELFAVSEQIQGYVEIYKKKKGTPDEKKIVDILKKLNADKKELEKRMDIEVSSLYKDAELKIDETKLRELEENWDSEMEPVEESTPGEQIQNLNNRLTKLRQDMAKAKSPEAKNVIQAKMKNALQKLSNKKKDMGIKKP